MLKFRSFQPRLVRVFDIFIDLVLKLFHEFWNTNIILKIVDPLRFQIWRTRLIYKNILISLPSDHGIWHPKLGGIDRKVPMEQCQMLYSKMPPLHWKLSWNAKNIFLHEHLAKKGLTLPEHSPPMLQRYWLVCNPCYQDY